MNTKFSDLIAYFRTLAAQHVAIGHSSSEKHFYRHEIEEILSGLKDVNYPALILEGYRYSLQDKQSDNILKNRNGAFCLVDHLTDPGDFDGIDTIYDNMEAICDDVLARIKADKRNPDVGVVRSFDLESVEVSLIANRNDRSYGIRCTYRVSAPLDIDVDSSKWATT